MTTTPDSFSRTLKQSWTFVWGDIERIGGTEARMMATAGHLIAKGHKVISVVRSNNRSSVVAKLINENSTETIFAPAWVSVLKSIKKHRSDVVWTFGLKQSIVVRIMKAIAVPSGLLVMPRNGLDYGWSRWMVLADVCTQRLVDVYISNSDKVGDHLEELGIAPQRVWRCTSGLPEEWSRDRTKSRSESFIMVGNNRPEKNHFRAVRAFLDAGVSSTLSVYTDDGAEIRRALDDYDSHARSKVKIIEGVKVGKAHYDESGVLLHPSTSESLPLTILEATARGCLVVAGSTGDIERIVQPDYGVTVDPEDSEDIKCGVIWAYNHVSNTAYERRYATHKSVTEYAEELCASFASRLSNHA